jgi:hypothetical protein
VVEDLEGLFGLRPHDEALAQPDVFDQDENVARFRVSAKRDGASIAFSAR